MADSTLKSSYNTKYIMTVAAALDIPAVQWTYTVLPFLMYSFNKSPAPFNLRAKSCESKSFIG